MAEIKHYVCDCGCGKTAQDWELSGWFILTQPDAEHQDRVRLYHNKKLYFVNLLHLNVWMKVMAPEAQRLQGSIRNAMYPRGTHPGKDDVLYI